MERIVQEKEPDDRDDSDEYALRGQSSLKQIVGLEG